MPPTTPDWFGSKSTPGTKPSWTSDFFGPKTSTGTGIPGMAANEELMKSQAADIVAQENQRYQSGLGTLTSAYGQSQNALSSLIDPTLLFSKASDAIGAKSIGNMNALRSSLGARGLNPNSGAASGLLSRLAFQQNNDITGATRDVAIENQRQRQVNAALNFQNALNLANYTNAPVSGANLETTQNIYTGQLAKYGIDKQAKSTKNAQKTSVLGGLIGAGASILGGLI